MPDILFDDHSFQVLKSFRPFLGDRGNGFVTTLESLQELLTSEPAQKTLQSFRLFGIGEKFNASLGDSVGVCTPTELEYKLSCRIHLPLVEAGDFFGVMLKPPSVTAALTLAFPR
ncbi:MAG: hypothetical protein ABSA82_10940 [Thermacetogeniaceae bacterium]